MWMRFCVMVQAQCTDGKTDKSDLICSQWDAKNQECLLVTQGLLSITYHRKMLEKLDTLEELQQKAADEAAELIENLPKAEEFGKSMITKREDAEAS